jgi:hypothetical protein
LDWVLFLPILSIIKKQKFRKSSKNDLYIAIKYINYLIMKKLYIIPVFGIFLFSCGQYELEFSCDPVINSYVSENREELSQITVEELVSYEPELQRAVFNSWDYRKKRSAWIDKLRFILSIENLTKAEIGHIQNLINHIEEDYFLDENIQHNMEARSQFASSWISYATKDLGWSKQYIAFIVYRLHTNQSQFEAEFSDLTSLGATATTNSEGSCDCNVSADFCSTSNCLSSGCTAGSSGCGWLWSMPCDGNCY